MNDCLSLPLRQGSSGIRPLTDWEALWMPLGEGEAERLPAGRGQGWEPVEVPRQLAASEGRQAVWYRTSLARPDHSGRVVLRIGGAFLATHVWLNGKLLGSHYGYFAPFGFDLTPYLRTENLLTICCESPVETDLSRKRHVMGIFNDGDCRPYPASAFFSLPEPYRWEVPLGLWRPVELEYMGSVALDWLRLKPRWEGGDGRLEVEARLRNLDARQMTGELRLEVRPPQGAPPIRLAREFRLPGGLEQAAAMTVSLPGAQRWMPWRLGEPHLYGVQATVSVAGNDSVQVEDAFGFRELDWSLGGRRWTFRVNGQPFFLRGANYIPSFRLDELDGERFDGDLELARAANLDALRVHGHVLPAEFYGRADAAGMLVLADFPLTGAYAYHASAEEAEFFEAAVREQVPEMVELLRNRPSVVLYSAHDDPPWVAGNAELADVHAVRQNHTVDHEIRALFERLDPSRPALAASGDLDAHLWWGWRQGGWAEFGQASAGLVTEYGAQALPVLDSPVWRELGPPWPVADDEPAWIHGGFQVQAWAEHGMGLPSGQTSLAAYVERSQRYQAFLLGYATDQLRKRKFEPCWGAFAFQLVDPHPGIGFGLLDASRSPRLAYDALRHAMAPARVVIDPVGYRPLEPFGFGYRPGEPVVARLVVVNDDPQLAGRAVLRWWVRRLRGRGARGLDRLRDAMRRKAFAGSLVVDLPTAAEPAVQAASLSLPLDSEGDYRLEAELVVGGLVRHRQEVAFRVSSDPPARRLRTELPRYLADRLVEAQSLRREPEGFSVTLENRTRPAVLTNVGGLRLDGLPLSAAGVSLETASGRVPLPRRVDLPIGRKLRLHVDMGEPLPAGTHAVELDLTILGVASGRVRVDGSVRPEDLRPRSVELDS